MNYWNKIKLYIFGSWFPTAMMIDPVSCASFAKNLPHYIPSKLNDTWLTKLERIVVN